MLCHHHTHNNCNNPPQPGKYLCLDCENKHWGSVRVDLPPSHGLTLRQMQEKLKNMGRESRMGKGLKSMHNNELFAYYDEVKKWIEDNPTHVKINDGKIRLQEIRDEMTYRGVPEDKTGA